MHSSDLLSQVPVPYKRQFGFNDPDFVEQMHRCIDAYDDLARRVDAQANDLMSAHLDLKALAEKLTATGRFALADGEPDLAYEFPHGTIALMTTSTFTDADKAYADGCMEKVYFATPGMTLLNTAAARLALRRGEALDRLTFKGEIKVIEQPEQWSAIEFNLNGKERYAGALVGPVDEFEEPISEDGFLDFDVPLKKDDRLLRLYIAHPSHALRPDLHNGKELCSSIASVVMAYWNQAARCGFNIFDEQFIDLSSEEGAVHAYSIEGKMD